MGCRFSVLTLLFISLLSVSEAATEKDVILTALERKPFNQFQELKKECSRFVQTVVLRAGVQPASQAQSGTLPAEPQHALRQLLLVDSKAGLSGPPPQPHPNPPPQPPQSSALWWPTQPWT